MIARNSAAALQRQMQDTRQDLDAHAEAMMDTARRQFDWRQYVARHPWTAMAAAAAVGYLIVPRRTYCKIVQHAPRTTPVQQAAGTLPRPSSPAFDVLAGVASAVGTLVARQGASFVINAVNQWLEQRRGENHASASGPGH